MAVLEKVAAGEVDLAFRRWNRPTVKSGGTVRTPIGMLAIESVTVVDDPATITDADARRSGAPDAAAVRAELARREGTIYRVEFSLGGADPQVTLRETDRLASDELAQLRAKLDRMDQRAADGPWTRSTLQLIADRPEVRAGDLADAVGRERLAFKADVRKLKALGLTESLLVGYRLSPRGRAVLDRL